MYDIFKRDILHKIFDVVFHRDFVIWIKFWKPLLRVFRKPMLITKRDTASPSNQGLLCCSSAIGIDSVEESEDSESDNSSEEDEEEGGDGGGPPARMLYRGVVDS